MLESSSLAFFEIHEPPTLKLVTFVNAFSIFFSSLERFSERVKTAFKSVTEQNENGDSHVSIWPFVRKICRYDGVSNLLFSV